MTEAQTLVNTSAQPEDDTQQGAGERTESARERGLSQASIDALPGSKDQVKPLIEELALSGQPAPADSAMGKFNERLSKELQALSDDACSHSSALDCYLHTGSRREQNQIKTDLIRATQDSTDPKVVADALRDLTTIALMESAAKVLKTASSNDPVDAAARFGALRDLQALSGQGTDAGTRAALVLTLAESAADPACSHLAAEVKEARTQVVSEAQRRQEITFDLMTRALVNPHEDIMPGVSKLDLLHRQQVSCGNGELQPHVLFLRDTHAGKTTGDAGPGRERTAEQKAAWKTSEYFMREQKAPGFKEDKDMLERQLGANGIKVYTYKIYENMDGNNFSVEAKNAAKLEGINGVTERNGYYSFKAVPVKEGDTWSMHILGSGGDVAVILNADGSVRQLAQKTTTADGRNIGYKHDRAGLAHVNDGHGLSWTRTPNKQDEWTLDRGSRSEKLTGKMTINADGTYTFAGTDSVGNGVKVEVSSDGTLKAARGDVLTTTRTARTGESTTITAKIDGDKTTITEARKNDSEGKQIALFKPVAGEAGKWQKLDKDGTVLRETTGELSASGDGSLVFTQKIAEKDGTAKLVGKDENNKIKTLSEPFKDGEKPVIWERAGQSDWWTSADGQARCARVESEALKDAPPATPEQERANTDAVIDALIPDANLRKAAHDNVQEIMDRAKRENLPPEQVAQGLRDLCKMAITPDGKTALPQSDRIKIFQQGLAHMARPDGIDQGHHNTCNVTVIEGILATKQPAVFAKVIADIALTGRFMLSNGTEVVISPDQLKADTEASRNPTHDGQRSHASQLFQLAAINAYYTNHGPYSDGKTIRYIQLPGDWSGCTDTGERLEIKDANGNLKGYAADTQKQNRTDNSPGLDLYDMKKAYDLLGGKELKVFSIEKGGSFESKGNKYTKDLNLKNSSIDEKLVDIDTPEQLGQLLEKMGKDGQLPVILHVSGHRKPIREADKPAKPGDSHASHVVLVRGYQPGPPAMVQLDNQWGRKNDKLVKLSDIFHAME